MSFSFSDLISFLRLALGEAEPRNDLGRGPSSEFLFLRSVTAEDSGLNAAENRRQEEVLEVFLERELTLLFLWFRVIIKKVCLSRLRIHCRSSGVKTQLLAVEGLSADCSPQLVSPAEPRTQ